MQHCHNPRKLVWVTVAVIGLVAALAGISPWASITPPHVLATEGKSPQQPPLVEREGLPNGAVARLGSGRLRHAGAFSCPTYSPDGRLIAVVTFDGLVRVWDAKTGDRLHQARIDDFLSTWRLAFSPDGKQLAVLQDNTYTLLDAHSGKQLRQLKLEKLPIQSLAISPDLKTLVRGGADKKLRFHDALTGKERGTVLVQSPSEDTGVPSRIVFAPDGRTVYVSAFGCSVITQYDVTTFRQVAELDGVHPHVTNLALSPDGRRLASFSRDNRSAQRWLTLWDLNTRKPIQLLDGNNSFLLGLGLAFSPDSRTLAVNFPTQVRLYDARTGRVRHIVQQPFSFEVAFHPNGRILALASAILVQWDLQRNAPTPASAYPAAPLFVERFVAKGRHILTLGDRARWWDAHTGRLLRQVKLQPEGWWYMSAAPDGSVAAAPTANRIRLFDLATGKVLHTLTAHEKAPVQHTCFSPDGKLLFSAGGHNPRILIWEVRTGKLLRELKGHAGWVDRLAISPDGKWLASAASSNGVPGDFDIRVWEVQTGRLAQRLNPGPRHTFALAFSPDARTLASGGDRFGTDENGAIQLWDLATGAAIATLEGHTSRGHLLAFSPDGRTLATAGLDDEHAPEIRLWEIASRQIRHRFVGHQGQVLSLAYSPDGTLLAATSHDAPAFVWDIYGTHTSTLVEGKRSESELADLWQHLADPDASKAFAAVRKLIASPQATSILGAHLRAVKPVPEARLAELLAQLNSPQFATREKASQELCAHGDALTSWLRKQVPLAQSAEVRRRLSTLLARAEAITPQRLQQGRALEVLGQIRTPEAQRILTRLARGAPEARLTREARVELKQQVVPPE